MVKPQHLSPPPTRPGNGGPGWNNNDDDDGFGGSNDGTGGGWAATMMLPRIIARAFKASLTITVVLYVLNQKHLLPRPLSAIVSKVLFWPTLPITVTKRLGQWMTVMDDTVLLGGAPFGFVGIPERLYHDHGVRGVINLCEEYRGPVQQYQQLGIRQLYLPTTDHFEPSLQQLQAAISFIDHYKKHGQRVYVHCRAGHGRSAAVVFAWLLVNEHEAKTTTDAATAGDDTDPVGSVDLEALNKRMSRLRNVRKGLWRQPNINLFYRTLVKKRSKGDGNNVYNTSSDNRIADDKEL